MNKNNNLGRFLLVIAIILWALFEVYPPTSRDLVQQFSSRALNRDAAFTNILADSAVMQKAGTNEFAALQLATGTNDLQKYFPVHRRAEPGPPRSVYLEQAPAGRGGQDQARLGFAGRHVVPRRDGHEQASPTPTRRAARCRRPSRCCASALTSSAWRSRSSSPPAATASSSSCPASRSPTRRARRRRSRRRRSSNSAW